MKGVGVSPGAKSRMRIDFETSPSGGQVYPRNKDYLNSVLARYLAWGVENNVPLYVGEFGLYKDCFAVDKGGVTWVSDMVDLLTSHGLHFTYHAYHELSFGIYRDGSKLPDKADASTVNTALINIFTTELPFHTLTISKNGSGHGRIESLPAGIDCGSICSTTHSPGTLFILTATADASLTFAGWSGACTGKGACSLALVSDKSVAATFGKPGDVNNDGNVDMTDLLIALKMATGMLSGMLSAASADVNEDGKIELSEAVFVLQKISGLR